MDLDEKALEDLSAAVQKLEKENRELNDAVSSLQKQVRRRELDSAYMYIHSNWLWIRWVLVRDQDRAGEDAALRERAKAAEMVVRDHLPRGLKSLQFDPEPMQAAYRWRIETTVLLNRHGYTFFD